MSHRPALSMAIVLAASVSMLAGCGDATPAATPAAATAPASGRSTAPPDPTDAASKATFGDWRRSPIQPAPDFATTVETACRAEAAVGDLPLAVLDARGAGRALLLFAGPASATLCTADVGPDGTAVVATRAIAAVPDATPPPTRRLGTYDLHIVAADARTYSVLVGQVGDGVDHVGVNFDADAAWYTAAMDHGWYAIWWPGIPKPIGVAAADARSVVIEGFAP